MFRNLQDNEIQQAKDQTARINRSALEIFTQALTNGTLDKSLVYDDGKFTGVMNTIKREDFYLVQLSFVEEPKDDNLISVIENTLEGMIEAKGELDLYFNTNLACKKIIDHFSQRGYKYDIERYEFRYRQGNFTFDQQKWNESGLEERGFNEEFADRYINVLDEAFLELDKRCNVEPRPYSRNRDKVITWLKRLDDNQEFFSYWHSDDLIGLVLLDGDCLDYLAIHPTYQNQGYGSQIIQDSLQKMFYEKNYPQIYLYVLINNVEALGFYKKNDFEITGEFCEMTYQG